MSGLINKVKEKIAEAKSDHNTSGSTNAGPHDSNAANKVDPRVDSDLDGRGGIGHNTTTGTGIGGTHHTTGTGVTGTHHTTGTGVTGGSGFGSSGANTTAGPHSSNLANKVDPRVDSDLSGGHPGSNTGYGTTGHTGTTGFGSSSANTTAGPHSSNLANKADPRVDSDLSGGHPGSNTGYGTTGHSTHTGHTGTTGIGSTGHSSSGPNTTAGPHNSDMLNKLDPRVDSDLSGGHPGSNAAYSGAGTTGSSGLTGNSGYTGTTGSSGLTGHSGSTNAGPHSSNFANAADPRVDSDLDGGRHAGLNQTTGHHGTHTGAHTGSHTGAHTGTTGTGPVHNSNLLNKLDPRVDSDAGIAQQSTNTHTGSTQHSGPLDASKHGPTAFREVHGDPTIHHDYPEDAGAGRHGSIGRSDQHYGSGAI